MTDKSRPNGRQIEKGGYRPLNEGYTPQDKRGYVPKASGGSLPKAPIGGTGQTSVPTNGGSSQSPPKK